MDPFNQALYEIFHITILPTLLRNYDRYSMASGVEVRMPFMDWRLVTFTFALPWQSKIGGGFTKRIMRDALKDILPEPIRTRRDKIGWNAPLHEWLKGSLRQEVEDLLHNSSYPFELLQDWNTFQSSSVKTFEDGQKMWSRLLPYLWQQSLGSKL
jgi:asparagine synthase (glutamine-hydrolysing)